MANLISNNERLISEWDFEKNRNLDVNKITLGSHEKVWWKCKKGHSYQSYIYTRVKDHGCPFCARQKAIIGENDLKTLKPTLANEWNYTKNKWLLPENFTIGSGRKVWWKCEKGHEWEASISNRSKGSNCPYCSGNKTVSGINDLVTLNPELIKEWNYTRNNNINPATLKLKSGISVWWICHKCGYEWKAKISNRSSNYNSCPHCNSIEMKFPSIIKEWDYEKNDKLRIDPKITSCGSSKKVWWICSKCGNNWQTQVVNRANGSGCPKCNSQTSFPEQAIFYYVSLLYKDFINRYLINNNELDIYIPSINVGIEYDGVYYHSNKIKNENKKDLFCQEKNIQLYRIRENGLGKTKFAINIFRKINDSYEDLDNTILKLLNLINDKINYDINSKRDELEIINKYKFNMIDNSIGKKHEDLLKDWDYEKNKGLDPFSISEYSKITLNWKCKKCNSEWKAPASMRSRGKKKCPYCSTLAAKNKELLKEWDYKKNDLIGIKPDKISSCSGIKVNWKCEKGHEWISSIANRERGTGCPYCSGNLVIKGENDLATMNPTLIEEWDFVENNKINIYPDSVKPSSGKIVNWVCKKCGNHWKTSIANRNQGKICPICARQKAWETRRENKKSNVQ